MSAAARAFAGAALRRTRGRSNVAFRLADISAGQTASTARPYRSRAWAQPGEIRSHPVARVPDVRCPLDRCLSHWTSVPERSARAKSRKPLLTPDAGCCRFHANSSGFGVCSYFCFRVKAADGFERGTFGLLPDSTRARSSPGRSYPDRNGPVGALRAWESSTFGSQGARGARGPPGAPIRRHRSPHSLYGGVTRRAVHARGSRCRARWLECA